MNYKLTQEEKKGIQGNKENIALVQIRPVTHPVKCSVFSDRPE